MPFLPLDDDKMGKTLGDHFINTVRNHYLYS